MKRKVVITGYGMITPLAHNADETWEKVIKGENGVDNLVNLRNIDKLPVRFGAQIKNYDPEKYFNKKDLKQYDLFTQYALIAAREAVNKSKIFESNIDKSKVGVILGTGIGGIQTTLNEFENYLKEGEKAVSLYLIPKMISNIAAGIISMEYGLMGVSYAISSACASAGHALGEALRKIQYGELDACITGGSEAPFTDIAIIGFSHLRALSKENDNPKGACKPFDKNRNGFVMGEGAGIVILEEYEHAKKRGAIIYGEFAGFGASSDAYHITASHPEGLGAAICMENAIKDSEIRKEDIGYINAHGTSTPIGDISETKAIKKVFGDYAYNINISSTKSMLGHSLGATGAIEFILTLLAVYHGIIPPTINYREKDPECDLNYTPNVAVERKLKAAISNSFGFGGQNSTCLIKMI